MSRSPSLPLYPKLRRYIAALAISMLLPLAGLLVFVLAAEHRAENASRELTLYHLRTETLAGEMRDHLNWLSRSIESGEVEERLLPFWSRKYDAAYQLEQGVGEILRIEQEFGCEYCAPLVVRIERYWNEIAARFQESDVPDLDRSQTAAMSVALLQLKRRHEIESAKAIDVLQSGRLPYSNLAIGGALVVAVSGLLGWRISRLMESLALKFDKGMVALRESETRFRQLSENVDAVFWITDADSKTALFVSPGFEKIWGRSMDCLEEKPQCWVEAIVTDDRERVLQGLLSIQRGKSWKDEYRIERPDGSIRWIRDRGFPVRDESGKVVRMAGVAADVTEEKLALEEVHLSERHLRSLMESAQGFVVYRTVGRHSEENGGRVVFVSPSIRNILGVPEPMNVGTWFDNVHEEDLPRIISASRRSEHDFVPFNEEMRIFHPGWGEWRWIHAVSHPVHDSITGKDYFNGIIVDITAEKRAQEELEKAFGEIQQLKELAEAENIYLREEMRLSHLHEDIIGESEALNKVMLEAERVSGTGSTVLLLGETGTGKELVARAIHRMSDRSDEPMLALNCAAIPATLVESELFGREKGAFTGASTSQMGRFEAADGGTIFLDEVGELPEAMQAKLLRVLEDGKFERLGSTKPVHVDVRVVAATNRDLAERVRAGEFREDLFYRLNVFPIIIPPLRERAEDIPVLARHFVKEFAGKMGKDVENISKKVLGELEKYSWPGNVRQLRNVIERGMIITRGKTLRVEIPAETVSQPLEKKRLAEVETDHIVEVLKSVGWKVRGKGGAAELLGLPASTLESRMKKLGIERPGKVKSSDPDLC